MIWLASFPRSGNTFFRNVLYEVYGLESSTWHLESNYPLEPEYDRFPVVKTHLLPHQLKPSNPNIKKVYIVRDGRDALVSMAHHRKDIVEPGTDFYVNLLEAILAMEGSFFGGWSENVKQWVACADVVIRFEDLIADPIREVEKLREIMDLPQPNPEKLPTFKSLKFGKPHYGSGKKLLGEDEAANMAKVNFRKGKAGGWREEMPPELEQLFWELHHEQMEVLGYYRGKPGESTPIEQAIKEGINPAWPYRILIEGNKTEDPHMDGVRRYLEELLSGLEAFQRQQPDKWRIDVFTQGKITPLFQYIEKLYERREHERQSYGLPPPPAKLNLDALIQKVLKVMKDNLHDKVYDLIIDKAQPIRKLLDWFREDTIDEKYKKARQVASKNHQLIHIPLPQNYYFVNELALLKVFTVHDMTHKLCPQFHDQSNLLLAKKGMDYISSGADAIINVSGSTQKDLLEEFPHLGDRSQIIYEAANADLFKVQDDPIKWAEIKLRYGMEDYPYFISLSTIEPRKNLKNIIEGFFLMLSQNTATNVRLVICGRKGWKHEQLYKDNHPFANRIHFTGHVLDEDLPWLYSKAIALCYVPHYEGFGLPPLEAMCCRTPVLYGNNSALPEIAGEAGLPVDQNDKLDIANQMARLLIDKNLRDELASKAFIRSRHFSWLKTAFQTLNVYEKTIINREKVENKNGQPYITPEEG